MFRGGAFIWGAGCIFEGGCNFRLLDEEELKRMFTDIRGNYSLNAHTPRDRDKVYLGC